jgi:hypothetical protein
MHFQMKLTAKNVMVVVFVVISFVSLGFIFAASLNYNNYYWQARSAILDPASNNTLVRSTTGFRDSSTGLFALRARVSVTNPTAYQGLALDQFALTLFCFHTGNISQSVFAPSASNLLVNTSPGESLGPFSTITHDLVFNLNGTQSSQLTSFNQTYNGDIQAHIIMVTRITSFFDSVFGGMTITKEQSLLILWS